MDVAICEPVRWFTTRPLEAPEKVDHRSIDFLRPLLLGPVAAAREHARPLEVRDELRQVENELVHTVKGDHQGPVSGNVERRDIDERSSKGSEEFPVAVDVAAPVQAPTKSIAREFPYEALVKHGVSCTVSRQAAWLRWSGCDPGT